VSQTVLEEVGKLYEHGKLLFLKAKTPLHAGVGRTYGEAVDLPIQRDENNLPVIWASSIKGALRASKYLSFKAKNVEKCLDYIYGPSTPLGEYQFVSCLSILDARLFLIPVRSLRGVYAYATSPILLEYLKTYLDILKSCCKNINSKLIDNLYEGISNLLNNIRESLTKVSALVSKRSREKLSINNMLILNEYFIKDYEEFESNVINELSSIIFGNSELVDRIVILSDDIFMRIVNKSIIVINRVKLKYETKTVDAGPWSEEYVPRGTVFVSAVLYSRPRFCIGDEKLSDLRMKANEACAEVLKQVCKNSDICSCDIWSIFIDSGRYMILGGHETIGKGIVEVVKV